MNFAELIYGEVGFRFYTVSADWGPSIMQWSRSLIEFHRAAVSGRPISPCVTRNPVVECVSSDAFCMAAILAAS